GIELYQEHPVHADVVVPVPDSGIVAAIGFSEASGIPFELGLIRNHYVGRTFIEPKQSIRDFGVKLKLNPIQAILKGKRVVVIDDSIVRGTTSRKLVRMIRSAGASEVHVRISSPPTIGSCRYGIDTPTQHELIATQKSVMEIQTHIEADSLGYLSVEGLNRVVHDVQSQSKFCSACFTLQYPIEDFEKNPPQRKLFELE
ncbi:amidophosphoribosyltransferase, partial [bacterium]|nr:amidophosphoribosyltransferase [candidate division CSSED10-310 bacterium]